MKISREVRTAVLVILGLLLLIYMYNFLKGDNLLNSSRTYHTVYKNVGGLAPSAPVLINGLNVGRVKSISFVNDGSGNLKVTFTIDSDFQFSKNSTVELFDNGLLGGKALQILPAFDNAENVAPNAYLKSNTKNGLTDLIADTVTPLQKKVLDVIVSADSTLTSVNSILDTNTKANLKQAIKGLTHTINSFNETSKTFNNILATNEQKLNTTLANAENISKTLSNFTNTLEHIDIAKTVKNLETTMGNFNTILANLEKGQGTMGKLLHDDALYKNLNSTMKEMEELLRDIKLHPKRYFRILSRKEIPYQKEDIKN